MHHQTFIIIDKRAFQRVLIAEFFSNWMDEKEISIITFGSVDEILTRNGFIDEIDDNAAIMLSIGAASISEHGVLKEIVSIKKFMGDCPLIILADDTSDLQVLLASEMGVNGLISTAMFPRQVVNTCEFILGGGSYLPNGRSQWPRPNATSEKTLASPAARDDRIDVSTAKDTEAMMRHSIYVEPSANSRNIAQILKDSPPTTPKCQASPVDRLDNLTERQLEVLKALVPGLSNKEIARELYLSDATVKVHIRNLLKKFDVTNRTQLALIGAKCLE